MEQETTMELGPNYAERVFQESQRDNTTHHRNSPRLWGIGNGLLYQSVIESPEKVSDDSERFRARYLWEHEASKLNISELRGTEKDIEGQLEKLMGLQGHVVLYDYSGGNGLSMIRIAADREKRFKDVSEGRLIIIVSNYNYFPGDGDIANNLEYEESVATIFGSKPDNSIYSTEDLKFIRDNQKLVTFLSGGLSDTSDHTVRVNGRAQPLKGSVDILHTRGAIFCNRTPDILLPELGNMLSGNGTLFVDNLTEQDKGYANASSVGHSSDWNDIWYTSLIIGYKNLLKIGLRELNEPNDYNYKVFQRPYSPEFQRSK